MSNVVMYDPSRLIAGMDEAGRGCIFGGVFSACVILDPDNPIPELNDSKKLSAKKRDLLYDEIKEKALYIGVGYASPLEVDEFNVLRATFMSMERALINLGVVPDLLIVDGNSDPQLGVATETIVKGDAKFQEISASSIIAKVERDLYMDRYHELYPDYGFDKHRGYGTTEHYKKLGKLGLITGYRLTFKSVK